METIENLNVALPADYKGEPIEIVLREGQAKPILNKQRIVQTVAIVSIGDFIEKKNIPSPVQNNPGLILFSEDEKGPFIHFYENPNDEEATILRAPLEINPDFAAFGINQDKQFEQKTLANLIRKFAHCFDSRKLQKL
jgi:hypothetical protein